MAVPSLAELGNYSTYIPGKYEAIQQSLYDFQAYAAAGATAFTFFQTPVNGSTKTEDDTNMTLAGQIPSQQVYLIQGFEIHFYPTVPAVAADNPAAFGAEAVANIVNDVYAVLHAGNFKFVIGSKPYLQEAPLVRLPPKTHMVVNAAVADASTAGADLQSRIAYAYATGRPYNLQAPLVLAPNMNFVGTIGFNTAVAITNPGRLGVVADGLLYRTAQ